MLGVGLLLKLINPVGAIVNEIAKARTAREVSKTDKERIAADERIVIWTAKRDIMIAETKHASTRWVRPGYAGIFMIYVAKVVVWDKVLGLGSTPELGTEMMYVMGAVISLYFIARPFEKRK